jgi:hypothetical protein
VCVFQLVHSVDCPSICFQKTKLADSLQKPQLGTYRCPLLSLFYRSTRHQWPLTVTDCSPPRAVMYIHAEPWGRCGSGRRCLDCEGAEILEGKDGHRLGSQLSS